MFLARSMFLCLADCYPDSIDRSPSKANDMKLMLRKPYPAGIQVFLDAQATLAFTYSPVGATASQTPAGYVVDRTRIKLGEGAGTFAAAKAALERWEHFRLGWVGTWPPETPIQAGQVVAVVARVFGLWGLHDCRIVCVSDGEGAQRNG